MIALDTFKKIMDDFEGRLPLLTLDEFFDGNPNEDAIAPNQWGYGRPSLAEIWAVLQKAEALPNVAWVRVVLHFDTEIEERNGRESLELCGDTIALCTMAQPAEIEKWVNSEWLCADGIIALKDAELNLFSCVPIIPEGFSCWAIVWD